MKKWFILLLLVIFLPACGTLSSTPAGVSDVVTPGLSMPLPDSEKTRIANEAPTFPIPETESLSATVEPSETQIPSLPTLTPSETAVETPVPSPTFPPSATQITQPPTLLPSVTLTETPLLSPTFPPSATIELLTATPTLITTPTSIAPISTTPTPEPTQIDQVPPQITTSFLDLLKFFIWPGSLCLGGLLLLALAVSMFFFQRRKTRPARRGLTLSDLDPGWGNVLISGKVSQIPQRLDDRAPFPLDGKNPAPLAVLRLAIEEYDVDSGGWQPLRDDARATPFILEDGTGTAWIDPQKQEVRLKGESFIPSLEQVRAALQILRLPPQLVKGERLRYRIWVLRSGESVSVMGRVQPRPQVLVRTEEQPLLLSSKNGHVPDSQADKRSFTSFGVVAATIGLSGLCISGVAMVLMLYQLLQ